MSALPYSTKYVCHVTKHVIKCVMMSREKLLHSFSPTCESYNVGNVVYVRTVERVAKGQELTICYVPEWFSLSRRQHELLRQYKFTCSCKRCAEQQQKQQQKQRHV